MRRYAVKSAAWAAAMLISAAPAAAHDACIQPPAPGAKAPSAAAPTPSLPENHPKYIAAKKVFDRIARAWGAGGLPPRLIVRPTDDPGGARIALYRPEMRTIEIDEAVIDLCAEMGVQSDDALAVLLGHELAHHYRSHGWVGDMVAKFADLDSTKSMKAAEGYDKLVKNETEADYFGTFYAYVAGYDALATAPAVFDRVYEKFKLADKLGGYPARDERKKIAQRRAEEIRGLQDLFDAGRAMLLLEQHEVAAAIFDYLAGQVPSRELLNNAAVARLMRVLAVLSMSSFDAKAPPAWALAYPVTLEMESRLGTGRGAPLGSKGPEGDAVLVRLLGEASDALEKALAMDENYVPARINLALALCLRNEQDLAAAQAKKAVKAAEQSGDAALIGSARTAQAIAVYGQAMALPADDAERVAAIAQARALLTKAAGVTAAARINLEVLDGKGRPPRETAVTSPGGAEKIGGIGCRDSDFENVQEDRKARRVEVPIGLGKTGRMNVAVLAGEGWRALALKWNDRTGDRTMLLAWAGPGYAGKTAKGVGVGAGMDEARAAYGQPARTIEGSRGRYEVFTSAGLIFEVGRDGKVGGWGLYWMKE